VVVIVGVMFMLGVVAPVFQVYVVTPFAVSKTDEPTHNVLVPVIVMLGVSITVTVTAVLDALIAHVEASA
jgi:hypothetical protein